MLLNEIKTMVEFSRVYVNIKQINLKNNIHIYK